MNNRLLQLLCCVVLLLFTNCAAAQQDAKSRQANFNLDNSLALQGYDVVSYFSGTKPLEGKASIYHTHKGVIYRFASIKNRDAFVANPERYEPQYGGWCAYAMGSSGEKVEIDPLTFKIVDGKLYSFYNAYFNNTLKKWNENEATLKRQADIHWTKITKP